MINIENTFTTPSKRTPCITAKYPVLNVQKVKAYLKNEEKSIPNFFPPPFTFIKHGMYLISIHVCVNYILGLLCAIGLRYTCSLCIVF